MKKIADFIFLTALLLLVSQANGAMLKASSLKTVGDNLPGVAGYIQHSTDNATVVWRIPDCTTSNQKIAGAYFWIKNVDGNAASVIVNFFTSYLFAGDTDWTLYTALAGYSNTPTAYDLTMPGINAVWNEKIPFPEGAQRVKAVISFSDNESTDNITIRMSPYSYRVAAQQTYFSGDYVYVLSGNTAAITSYSGSDSALTIPLQIDHHIVSEIKSRAFKGNQNLVSLTIPSTVKLIGREAFSGCTNLSSLTIYSTVKVIDDYAFYGCSSLPFVRLYGSQPRMGRAVFDKCAIGFKVLYFYTATGFTKIWNGYKTQSFR